MTLTLPTPTTTKFASIVTIYDPHPRKFYVKTFLTYEEAHNLSFQLAELLHNFGVSGLTSVEIAEVAKVQ